jgi:hypothetical protein
MDAYETHMMGSLASEQIVTICRTPQAVNLTMAFN